MSKNNEEGLLVIGAGLGRTGTTSLKLALELLLGGKCYHMSEVHKDVEPWIKAFENKGLSHEEWQEVFNGYNACVDYPGATLFEHLMTVYPDAKIILSVRDPKSWVTSARDTIDFACKTANSFPSNLLVRMMAGRFSKFLELAFNEFNLDDLTNNEEKAIENFIKWNDYVKSKVPPQKLLVFEASMGWKPLCEFLNLPIPDVDYPRTHDTNKFRRGVYLLKISSYVVIIGLPTVVAAGAYFLIRRFVS